MISGATVMLLSLAALIAFGDWEEWAALVMGLWLVVSPWVLGFPHAAAMKIHIAVNGARPSGTEVAVALAGDAAELIKPDVTANVLGLGVPPLRELLDKCIDQNVPVYV